MQDLLVHKVTDTDTFRVQTYVSHELHYRKLGLQGDLGATGAIGAIGVTGR